MKSVPSRLLASTTVFALTQHAKGSWTMQSFLPHQTFEAPARGPLDSPALFRTILRN